MYSLSNIALERLGGAAWCSEDAARFYRREVSECGEGDTVRVFRILGHATGPEIEGVLRYHIDLTFKGEFECPTPSPSAS
jgi:hypothetical protein